MSYVSVCKNVIAQNNKNNWQCPLPAIRVSRTKAGKATQRAHTLAIVDKDGNEVARIISSQDGKPVIRAGAKVVIQTSYPTVVVE